MCRCYCIAFTEDMTGGKALLSDKIILSTLNITIGKEMEILTLY